MMLVFKMIVFSTANFDFFSDYKCTILAYEGIW